MVKATTSETAARPAMSRDSTKILGDCRDLAISRLTASFASMLDRVGDLLMDRANKSDVRDEQQVFLDAREALRGERPALMAEFERQLRHNINDRIVGKVVEKQEFSKVDASNLTLVDTSSMDESVLTGNITRIVENACHDELLILNRGLGYLLGRPDLETDANPMSPSAIVEAFAEALKSVKTERRVKFQILKELNQAPMGEIAAIYADLNKHLSKLNVLPSGSRPNVVNRGGAADRARARADTAKAKAAHDASTPPPEIDVMAMFKRMYGSGTPRAFAPPPQFPQSPLDMAGAMGAAMAGADLPQIQMPSHGSYTFAPMPPTPSGYVPGAPIISTQDLHEGLTRLQAGQTDFDVGGAMVDFSGIPQGMHNVLRDLQESPLGQKANQLESMTIEMVAMLFDFIFETRDLPDGIKALLARLQIPVLKAAMLDGAFFAKKSHPSRLLVNELAQAGLGWSPVMGQDDPLYRTIDGIVHQILDNFSDDLSIWEDLRVELEKFLAEEEKAAEANIQSTAEEINQRDRQQISQVVAKSEIERRIENYPVPNFLANFLRQKWEGTLTHVHLHDGEESEAWNSGVTTLEDLVWSVQPKKTPEDRRHLVALLPSLLKRLSAGMHSQGWPPEEREGFMANLVEAHAASVKPSLASQRSPTAAVAEAAMAQAEMAKAAGDETLAAKAEALAEAMTEAAPEPVEPERVDHRRRLPRDRAQSRARHVDRVRGRRRPAGVRQAGLGEPAARHVPLHQPAGPEGAVDDGRRPRRALPQRPRAPGRGGTSDRPRVLEHDDADGRKIPGGCGRMRWCLSGAVDRCRQILAYQVDLCAATFNPRCKWHALHGLSDRRRLFVAFHAGGGTATFDVHGTKIAVLAAAIGRCRMHHHCSCNPALAA